jgi:hypothetical protein
MDERQIDRMEEKINVMASMMEVIMEKIMDMEDRQRGVAKVKKEVLPTHPTMEDVQRVKDFLGEKYRYTGDDRDKVKADDLLTMYRSTGQRASHIWFSRAMSQIKIKRKRDSRGIVYLGMKQKL